MDDGFGIMVVSGCRKYVTEPVDMGFGGPLHIMYGDVVVVLC